MSTNLNHKIKTYQDILNERQFFCSDVCSILKKWPLPQNSESHLSPAQIKQEVFKSDSVQQAIQKISDQSKKKREDVQKEADLIIDRMTHDFCSRSFRSLLYLVLKILKNIFTSIEIDELGFEKLKQLVKNHNVILLPTHRSYVDFLLISTVLFLQEIPIPVIAATEDFLNMAIVGSALRETGAFFIKRGKNVLADELYWTILTKFVHTVVKNGHHPLKFYVEGTRSRTGKSLYPKIGLLRMALDLYLQRKIPDLIIVPMSISYDRVLEERLYAHELLGIPKPKESTMKLLESMSVFQESYGSVYLSIGNAISVHEFMKQNDLCTNSVIPRNLQTLSRDNVLSMRHLSLTVIKSQLDNLIISSFCVAAFLLIHCVQQCQYVVNAAAFNENLAWLMKFIHKYRGITFYEDTDSSIFNLHKALQYHQNLVFLNNGNVCIRPDENQFLKKIIPEDIAINPVPSLMITYYANHLLQLLITPCLIVVAVMSSEKSYMTLQSLEEDVIFLSMLLQRDFIFVSNRFECEFKNSIDAFTNENLISQTNDQVKIQSVEKGNYLQCVVLPLIFIRKVILDNCRSFTPVKDIINLCKQSGIKLKKTGFQDCRILCKDTVMNAIHSLIDCNYLIFSKSSNEEIKSSENATFISTKIVNNSDVAYFKHIPGRFLNCHMHFKNLNLKEIAPASSLHSKL
ncbi:Dihydroxyacetone phosphate acyltransferase [Nymphon striatum]|nr:Dihydroxyacetone phosphate acyltransferase [Nymphon striatum]